MMRKEKTGLTVIVRNSSGTRIRYPDGRVEGDAITVSATRQAMVVEGINRIRRENALKQEKQEA